MVYYSHDLPRRNFKHEVKLWETRAVQNDVVRDVLKYPPPPKKKGEIAELLSLLDCCQHLHPTTVHCQINFFMKTFRSRMLALLHPVVNLSVFIC